MTELSIPVRGAATFFSEGTRDLSKVAEGKETSQHSSGKNICSKKKTKNKHTNSGDDNHQEWLHSL